MIPIVFDPLALPIAVAGRGDAALARFRALLAGRATDTRLFLDPQLPGPGELEGLRFLWIVGLPEAAAAELAARARSAKVLVNVEDRPELCDFHNVAQVRQGDLLLTVSTGGASPRLAARIRARLAAQFGPEWADRLLMLRRERAIWRRDGQSVADLTDALLHANGWLI